MREKLIDWLKTQPKEFAEDVLSKEMLGDGHFTIEELRELDLKFNPVGDEDNE